MPALELANSIQQLAAECSIDATATAHALLAQDQSDASPMANLRRFSNAVCGLSIVLASLDGLDLVKESPRNSHSFAAQILASFGAQLIADRQLDASPTLKTPAPSATTGLATANRDRSDNPQAQGYHPTDLAGE